MVFVVQFSEKECVCCGGFHAVSREIQQDDFALQRREACAFATSVGQIQVDRSDDVGVNGDAFVDQPAGTEVSLCCQDGGFQFFGSGPTGVSDVVCGGYCGPIGEVGFVAGMEDVHSVDGLMYGVVCCRCAGAAQDDMPRDGFVLRKCRVDGCRVAFAGECLQGVCRAAEALDVGRGGGAFDAGVDERVFVCFDVNDFGGGVEGYDYVVGVDCQAVEFGVTGVVEVKGEGAVFGCTHGVDRIGCRRVFRGADESSCRRLRLFVLRC